MDDRTLLVYTPYKNTLFLKLDDQRWNIVFAENIQTAQQLIDKHRIRVALYDLSQEDNTGPFVDDFFTKNNHIYWIALVTQTQLTTTKISQNIANLFYDYHTLPIQLDLLQFSLGHAYGMAEIAQKSKLPIDHPCSCHGMVGECKEMKNLFHLIDKISDSQAPVLITGESGTGKELVAQAIHANSRCRKKPIIEVNCGSIAKDLIQSELFGHEKGAFTGAHQQKIGSIEAANGGTLFLDEVGDLPYELQVNLLRFIQEGTIKRVGSNTTIPVNVRIISATNVNLEGMIKTGEFRKDLYYRLNVLHLETPPLRERNADIVRLANVYLELFRSDSHRRIIRFSTPALVAMQQYNWPGNVRELINRIRRAIVMSENPIISAVDLDLQTPVSLENDQLKLEDIRNYSERNAIIQALSESGSNITQTAKILGISRRSLYRLMEKHEITPTFKIVSQN